MRYTARIVPMRGSATKTAIFITVGLAAAAAPRGLRGADSNELALSRAKAANASDLDPALPGVPFERWFRDVLGAAFDLEWEVNDCGEQSGDPATDAARDMPVCAEARGVHRDGTVVAVQIRVGSEQRGVSGRPSVWWAYVQQADRIQEIDGLRNLRATLAAWRNDPAPLYRPGLAEAVDTCCQGLRLPAATDLSGAWSMSQPDRAVRFSVEGDFNGDDRPDAAVLLIDARDPRAPVLGVFEGADSGYRLAHRRKLERVADVLVRAPQEIVLRLVRRGEEWAPESGDVPREYPHAHDAIETATEQLSPAGRIESRLRLTYWDGSRYTEY